MDFSLPVMIWCKYFELIFHPALVICMKIIMAAIGNTEVHSRSRKMAWEIDNKDM